MASNVSCVLFVLALVFAAIILLVGIRTCVPMLKCQTERKQKTTQFHVFKLFYSFVWAQVLCTDILYWTVSMKMINNQKVSTNFFKLIVLVYVPTILMVFNYALLYYTHEKLKIETTIRSGVAYRSRFRSQSCANCIRIALLVVLCLFVVS